MISVFRYFFAALVMLVVLAACTSSGPKTQYYSLFVDSEIERNALENTALSFGVGPIVLPEFVDHPGIVSIAEGNRLIVSGYNAWGGELKENVSRVIAGNLSVSFDVNQVWSFPWDNRVRPDYQLRIVFEDFSGFRGGKVNLVARWTLLDKTASKVILVGKEVLDENASSSSYNAYVDALNRGINRLSNVIAQAVSRKLNH